MSALTLCAFKHANSSSKSFVTFSCQRRPLCAQLVDRRDALVGRHLPPEVPIGSAFFSERRALPNPQCHGAIIALTDSFDAGIGVSRSRGVAALVYDFEGGNRGVVASGVGECSRLTPPLLWRRSALDLFVGRRFAALLFFEQDFQFGDRVKVPGPP
jgi:hypothetical protein